ncbi:unnamed protein product [Thlaspi arvense]|uniref:Protein DETOXIFICATION n=1 Tax=Thlaspi arvense TaxID=13288 RepID=A0AAU9SGQ3_THLAR|nr:unnamed protein product [Thlaspi arvense]
MFHVNTNVANELGAGNSGAAKATAVVAIIFAAVESFAISSALFFSSYVWGYAYSNAPEVIHYAAEITPILCVSSVRRPNRGSGKQKIGAYVNIAAFYIVGIPMGLVFCFILDFKVKVVFMVSDQFFIFSKEFSTHQFVFDFLCNDSQKKKKLDRKMAKGFSLVRKEDKIEEKDCRIKNSAEMMKKVSSMAAPMVAVSVSQYLLQVISMVMAGHLDELSLSGVAIATSLTNVTGFSLLFGFAGALETLCGQAFGAEQFRKINAYTYSSMLCLLLLCFPISLVWVFMDKVLEVFHQDPLVSQLACTYSIWLIPALFGYAILQSMTRYFQSQGLVLPLFLSALGALCFHIPFCWLLVYKLRFGIVGAALSIGVSYWFNVGLLWVFMRDSALYRETRNLRAQEIFSSMKQFIALAVPSAMLICLEWWSFELLILLSGLLPNSKLETSVMSICLTTSALHYVLVDAIGAAASTHVSNELGAGNPRAARAAAKAAIFLGAFDASLAAKARDRVIQMTPGCNQETESILKEDVQVLFQDFSENV